MTTSSLVIYMYKKAVYGFLLTNRKNHELFLLTHAAQLMIYSVITNTIQLIIVLSYKQETLKQLFYADVSIKN